MLLQSGTLDESEVIMTYEVNNDDLNNYRRVKDYKPGKANPFSSYETATEGNTKNSTNGTSTTGTATSGNGTTTGSGNGGSTTSESSTTSNTTSENTTSGGHFFQDKGTK